MAKNTIKTEQLFSQREHTEDELALKGASHNAARLADAARTRLVLAAADEDALAEWGFDAGWRKLMSNQIAALTEEKSNRALTSSAARPTAASAGDASDELHRWVKTYTLAVSLAPKAVQAVAPHAAPGWDRPAQMAELVQPLVKFVERKPALTVKGGLQSFAARGRAALARFTDSRTVHASVSGQVSSEIRALHIREGVVALELQRLAKVAKEELPPKRAAQYRLADLRHKGAGRAKSPRTPATPGGGPAKTP